MDRLGRDKLFYCIIDLNTSDALQMIDEVDNVNVQDKNGYSYLHAAVQSESSEIIMKLLHRGAEIDIKDQFGKTPLMLAIAGYRGDRSIIDLLIRNGADKEAKANSNVSCMQLATIKGIVL